MPENPVAFMCYVRFNDKHDDGQLSAFRERLSNEVRMQTGEEFAIFQDRNDIAWGQSWQQRIDEALDAVTLLLVIITPGLFRSAACRAEISRFLNREQELGRADLILPVYYVSAREIDDPGLRESDEVARVLASRQYADWRELRYEPFTSSVARRAIAQLAARIRDIFWQPPVEPTRPAGGRRMTTGSPFGTAEAQDTADKVTARTEFPTHVVDGYGRGNFATIGEAIRAADSGDRILIRPGLYEEGLVIDKPLEILGDGPVADIEIRARGADTVTFRASIGRIANLTLRQAGGEGEWYGMNITQGRLDLEGCDISSQSLACVAIRNGADPRLRRNHVHSGKKCGILVQDNGLGTLEDNDITGNALAGVEISTGGSPVLRRNQIRDGKQGGVFVHDNGRGTLEDNDVTGNALAGVEISAGGNVTLRANRINRNGFEAILVYADGRGIVEGNDLTGNGRGAWAIAKDCIGNMARVRNKE